jgi:tetratricopeptide (TPR) repeat protein
MARHMNPYITDIPVKDKTGFFGRQDILEWVLQASTNPDINALVLSGPRRIGKTSLLLQLEHFLPGGTFLPIYFDLHDKALRPLGYVLDKLASKIARRIKWHLPEPELFDDQGNFFQKSFLPKLYRNLDKGCRPVFILDEFDSIDQVIREESPENAAANVLHPFLRELMSNDLRSVFVFATGRQVEEYISLDFATPAQTFSQHQVWGLDKESSELLVRYAEANGTLQYTDQAVERILSLTCGHPYLIQLLCQRIWEQAYSENPACLPQVNIQDVEAAIPDTLEAGQHSFSWLWNGLHPTEKIYAAALAEIGREENRPVPHDEVIQTLKAHGSRLCIPEIEIAPQNLIKRWILEKPEKQMYRFTVDLIRLWVHNQKHLREVKDELDRIEPFAEQLYTFGMQSLRRNQLEDALDYFHRALKVNPHHFRARINQGEVLLKLDQVDEAVVTLEHAFELDELETHLLLARALVVKAKLLEKNGDPEGALTNCIRAINISPDEKDAQQFSNLIWTKVGNTAMEQGQLEKALIAYQHLGAKEWDDAITFVRCELDKDSTLYRTRFYLSEVLLRLGQAEDAVAELNAELIVYQQANDEYKKEVVAFIRGLLDKYLNIR